MMYIHPVEYQGISIHSLRVEGDAFNTGGLSGALFQSTPSVWRETDMFTEQGNDKCISIHSLRVEGDNYRWIGAGIGEISIHSLRVEGDVAAIPQLVSAIVFQSTPSVWRETFPYKGKSHVDGISIHSLRVEGDNCINLSNLGSTKYFNPLPPCGGRRTLAFAFLTTADFNPLPPCGGRRS